MTELNSWTKIISHDNLVHTKVTIEGITNWSLQRYMTVGSNINQCHINNLAQSVYLFIYLFGANMADNFGLQMFANLHKGVQGVITSFK